MFNHFRSSFGNSIFSDEFLAGFFNPQFDPFMRLPSMVIIIIFSSFWPIWGFRSINEKFWIDGNQVRKILIDYL
jgi:hypothetical protein